MQARTDSNLMQPDRRLERASEAAQPTAQIYSTYLLGDTWEVEVLFDNLLHQGVGPTEADAVLNARDGIAEVLSGQAT